VNFERSEVDANLHKESASYTRTISIAREEISGVERGS